VTSPMRRIGERSVRLIGCLASASLVATALTSTAGGGLPQFSARVGFNTPSGNIACNAGPLLSGGGSALSCVLFSASGARGQKTWYMRQRGRAGVALVQGNAGTDFPRLRYGKTWKYRGFKCSSRMTGLTCRNSSGHGFFLSRGKQRRF
jgi:hypothetical protein